MGKIKNYLHDWLEEYGYDLGYDIDNAPELPDLWWVADGHVNPETYWKSTAKDKK
tara:strand:- start:11629 stop:11793 length:165 start_codon:yes stop_codon:yes gene_type:complete